MTQPKILMLSISRASQITGLDRRKLKELIEQGQLPAMRLGGPKNIYYRVRLSDLDAMFRFQNVTRN